MQVWKMVIEDEIRGGPKPQVQVCSSCVGLEGLVLVRSLFHVTAPSREFA